MKSDAIIAPIVVFLYGSLTYFGAILPRYGPPDVDWVTILSSLIAATLGAISGAFAAFKLEEKRRKKDQIKKTVADGNRILLDLFDIWNNLTNYSDQVVGEIDTSIPEDGYWFALKSTLIPRSADALLDPNRYEFLLGTKGSDAAARLRIERRRYELFLWQVEERSRILRESARPRWEAAGLVLGSKFSMQQIIDVTGPNVYGELRDITRNILKFLPEDIASSRELFRELRSYLVDIFPSEAFIDFELQAEAQQDDNNG